MSDSLQFSVAGWTPDRVFTTAEFESGLAALKNAIARARAGHKSVTISVALHRAAHPGDA